MNGFLKVLALTAVAAVAGIEVGFKLQGGADKEAAGIVMRMAIGAGCPDKPEALKIATASAYSFSLRNPLSLPPWHVFIARHRIASQKQDSDNPFHQGFCDAIIQGKM